jgi:class 3 adenylate cyclase/DNA-binding SARP family transcriptional activator/tetratricopeptide (TPR) repeat protein
MEVRLLGLVEASVDGRALLLGGAKQRTVLAMLALRANTTVSMDHLIEGLWGEQPPQSAPKMVQSYVSKLRKLLDDQGAEIVTRGRGYELRLPADSVDALRFERLIAAAERDDRAARGDARDALSLWRGPPLDDLADEPFAAAEIRRLEELWLRARELALDDALAAGEHVAVVGELQQLVVQHPLRERLHAQRMLALYRCGRQAEALEAYRQARAMLVGEVGVEPGPELQRLHDAVLQHDPALDLPAQAEHAELNREVDMSAVGQSVEREPLAGMPGLAQSGHVVGKVGWAPAGVELPEHLAEKVRRAPAPREGERKQVTVLFCDVQGSMELAESLDPELWRDLLDRFLAVVSEAVHSYEGTVNRFTGDGAMALFGAPIAHEDHARRACHAALRLRDALAEYGQELRAQHGVEFAVRLGLNSGEVVVGAVGDDLQMEYTAIGHTVGLAARMEEAAEPGKPCLTRQTAGLVEGYFELEDLGELEVKGVRQPVHAYGLTRAANARTRLDAAAGRGLSPFVGRKPELAALDAALDRARETGQVVGVVAEPGVGKSRVCREFADACRARGIRVTVGGGVAHGRRAPLLPVIELLRVYFGIVGDDDPQAARAKVVGSVLDRDFCELLPVLFDFLGVPDPERPVPAQMAPEARERALFAATRRLIETPAEEDPGLLVVEDLHWLDRASEAFLGNLVEALPGTRTLLLVTFRPEYRADWTHRSYYEQLPLVPLQRAHTAQLVEALTGTDPSLDGLSQLIAERTGGNPFFIEEVVQGLAESESLEGDRGDYRLTHPIEAIEIPASVQALLAARIDRLADNEKAVLQCAAVIGREFSAPVLRRVTGLAEQQLAATLNALAWTELLYQRELYPEAQYAFKHPLTQEVAYQSQLRDRRANTHADAARALEALHPDKQDELAAVISNHWEQAREPLRAARWEARAAAWAGRSHAVDALHHLRRVRALARDRPDSPEATHLVLGACIWILHAGARIGLPDEEVEETYQEARELAAAAGDDSAMAMVRSAYGAARGATGRLEEAIAYRREAQALAEKAGNLELQVSFSRNPWLAFAGRNREALADLDRTLKAADGDVQLGRQVIGLSVVIFATLYRGIVLAELGRLPEARAACEQGLRLAREHDDAECLGWAHVCLSAMSYFTGEPGDGLAHGREALELAERRGGSLSRALARLGLAAAHLGRNEHAAAHTTATEGLEIIRETHTGRAFESWFLNQLADARLGLDAVDGARAAAAEGATIAARQGARVREAACRLALGRALLLQDRAPDTRVELQRAVELAGEDGPAYTPHVLLAFADLARLQRDDRERLRQLGQAHRLFQQQGASGQVRRVAAEIATAAA